MEKSTKYAIAGVSAGAAAACAPLACGMYLNMKRKPLDDDDFLFAGSDGFVTRDGRPVCPVGLDLSADGFRCTKDSEAFEGTQKEIFDELASRFGNYGAREIFARYYENFISKSDVKAIKKAGVNIVRIPLESYVIFKDVKPKKADPSLDRLEKLIKSLGKSGIYTVLSLDSAPGAEDDGFFENSKKGFSLRNDVITMWTKISARFKDEPAVAAYDILDTPALHTGGGMREKFYLRAVKALRSLGDMHTALLHLDSIEDGAAAEKLNVALAVSSSYCSMYDSRALADKLAGAEYGKTAVMLTDLRVSSYADAFPLFAQRGIYGIAARYKGTGDSLYGGTAPSFDLALDTFDSINEKLKNTAGVKNYTLNKNLQLALKSAASGIEFAKAGEPVKIHYSHGKTLSAGI